MLFEELLKDLKKHRNDMVARNYPFQQLSNLIVKYEDLARAKEDTPHKEWIDGYNKWKSSINNNDTDNTGNTNTKYDYTRRKIWISKH